MSSKKIKELENRIVELEDYINSLKKKEWKEKYPNGQLVCSMYEFFYKYSYNEKEIPLKLVKDDMVVCSPKILKVNCVDYIDENIILLTVKYELYKTSIYIRDGFVPYRTHYIANYYIDKGQGITIKIKDEEDDKGVQRRNNYEFYDFKRIY